tara:strand:- start:3606 stop:3947 length:342 start_codon:yes stop_codon:yes gene_type:complete
MNIHLGDLTKLDELIEHAAYHQEEFGDDWFAFFQKHLGSEKEKHLHEEHPEEHEKLPHHDHLCSTVLSVVILQEEKKSLNFTKSFSKEKKTINYIEHYSFLAPTDIFQPPKQA